MSNAEYSGRRRRVIFMNSDTPDLPPQATSPPKPARSAPRRLRESDLPQSLLSQFRTACGQTCPFLIHVSSSETGSRAQTVLWDRPSLIIGRAQECDLRLPHAEVSRLHAYLQVVGGRIFCTDLSSGTGTHWAQGSNRRQEGPLDFGEPVSIGPYSLTIEPAPQLETFSPFEPLDPAAVPSGLFLDFHDGENPARRWAATRDVTLIGSGHSAKISLVHSSVSKCHCAILRAGHALWVVDLLSEEGTTVNGELINTVCLEAGDRVQVGRFAISAHYGSPLDDETISVTPSDPEVPTRGLAAAPPPPDLNRLQQQALAAARHGNGAGVSEQFVLDVINQMGVMQQQALQHAQQSMAQALQAITASYQGRIEALEQEYADLKRQLRGLPGPRGDEAGDARPALPDYGNSYDPLMPPYPDMSEPEFADLPRPEHGSYECDDPVVKEQWVREKMKAVEAELDKTRKGWGKRLIDLMGY
jgi:pSer/pThr/pTyr-binding forkhead associated (FHA) protein